MEHNRLPTVIKTRFGSCLALYGCLLALLAWLGAESGARSVPATPFVVGTAGLLCAALGIELTIRGHGKAWAALTLAVLALTLIVESVHGWIGESAASSGGILAPAITTTLLLTTMALLMWLLHGPMSTAGPSPRTGQPKPTPHVSDHTHHS
jgi:hypothetical protein